MRKAIRLTARLSRGATGALAPQEAAQALRDVLGAGGWRHPQLAIQVRQVAVDPGAAGALRARLWVEGEDEPADDFARLTTGALHDVVAAGRWRHPRLRLAVAEVAEDRDEDGAAE